MRIWVVGDLHGCFKTFQALLNQIQLTSTDRVICIGDLINRGEKSAEILDLFTSDHRFSSLLGNHDWAFILTYLVRTGPMHEDFKNLAAHAHVDAWIHWLRSQPFVLSLDKYFLTHAGCWPYWTIYEHLQRASRLHTWFKQCSIDELKILDYYLLDQNKPFEGSFEDNPIRNYAFEINVFTKMRYLSIKKPYHIELSLKGHPNDVTQAQPWFKVFPQNTQNKTILFGHWSALEGISAPGFEGIDTGCVWGGALTALELFSGRKIIQRSLERNSKQSD
jgi:bis(5'-nucleosyl)-tetraphosphatase (symmetrical)